MSLVNISIDDISPHPLSSIKVVDRCYELINLFPDIKFTLFVPSAYWRPITQTTKKPLYLSEYREICEKIKNLDAKNFEIGFHGHLHGIPNKSNNDEVAYLNYDEATVVFRKKIKTIFEAGLADTFKPIFRPPAWRMSDQAIQAAIDMGIEILALSKESYAKRTYNNLDKKEYTVYETCNPPFKPLALSPKTEIVYHACEWDKNYLNKEKTQELASFLNKNKHVKFTFMEDMLSG